MKYESDENIYDDIKESIRSFLYKKFIDTYTTKVKRIDTEKIEDVV